MTPFENTLKLLKNPAMIASYLGLLVLSYIYIDMPLAAYVHQWDLRVKVPFLKIFTILGEEVVWFMLLTLMTCYFRFVKKDSLNEARSLFLFLCVFIASVICCTFKIILGRARPELWFSIQAYGFYWFKINSLYWSMPSGHTTTSVSLAAGIGILFPRYFAIALGLAGLIICSRIILYYHYLSDVMSALYLSILIVGLIAQYAKKFPFLNKVMHFK